MNPIYVEKNKNNSCWWEEFSGRSTGEIWMIREMYHNLVDMLLISYGPIFIKTHQIDFGFFSCSTRIWTQGLHLEPIPANFCDEFFRDKFLWTICPGWLWPVILLISASWVARIIGVSPKNLDRLHSYDVFTLCKFYFNKKFKTSASQLEVRLEKPNKSKLTNFVAMVFENLKTYHLF
jgi:hypothetical protein